MVSRCVCGGSISPVHWGSISPVHLNNERRNVRVCGYFCVGGQFRPCIRPARRFEFV